MAVIKYRDSEGNWVEVPTGGGGGGSAAELYPTEYSSEFNDDFTN